MNKIYETDPSAITQLGNECPILPEGIMRWTCCAECNAGDYDAKKDMVWCGKYRHWYNGSDGCSNGPNG